jgi:tetrahydromethanopterin S-methyltransferase subunit A
MEICKGRVAQNKNSEDNVFTLVRKKIYDAAGKVCETVIPIKHEYYYGKGSDIAICTLSSIDLLQEISKSSFIMNKILIVGRLLSENRGIDAMIRFSVKNPSLRHIVVCGVDVKGHRSGHALLSLHKNGIDRRGRILGSDSPYPILSCNIREIEVFRSRIVVHDLVGNKDVDKLATSISNLN